MVTPTNTRYDYTYGRPGETTARRPEVEKNSEEPSKRTVIFRIAQKISKANPSSVLVRWILSLGFFIFAWIVTVLQLASEAGLGVAMAAAAAAAFPFAFVLLVIYWIDYLIPVPNASKFFALSWGLSCPMLIIAFMVVTGLDAKMRPVAGSLGLSSSYSVLQAPIQEEIFKAAGLVIPLLLGRKFISGARVGLICGALIGVGFSYSEDVVYFVKPLVAAQATGDAADFWEVFVARSLTPFGHSVYTGITGLALGLAGARRSIPLCLCWGLGGLSVAVALHAQWNGSTYVPVLIAKNLHSGTGFASVWLILMITSKILLMGGIVIWVRWRERTIIDRYLSHYGRAGWFSPDEVSMLRSHRARSRARRVAAERGGIVAKLAMRDFQYAAVALADHRKRLVEELPLTPQRKSMKKIERDLLHQITCARRLLSAVILPVVDVSERGRGRAHYNGEACPPAPGRDPGPGRRADPVSEPPIEETHVGSLQVGDDQA
ncbi:PrsW family intramembrane metalloprotease [Devriesea agamarum]|uniref:PrsW family intramembrane metalloprotease n=1 Tax=Devriesea agamarum TaxID=472569 RepID=UPI00071CDF1E|nr:PrsW family intramembrane metalloprotease [Devriesea agamarum]